MTAQAPYESLPVLPHTTYNGFADGSEPLYTAEQMRAYARAALAALPERTPVSAGGDAVAWQYRWRISANREWSNWTECDDPANHPEERGNPNCEFRALYATPAPPVGADWVVVPRVATDAMLLALFGSGVRHQFNVGTDEQRAEIMRNVRDTYEAMIAAAPTPAEARGVGDGVRALVAKWRAEANGTDILDCSKSGLMNYCADELEAALAANKPAGEVFDEILVLNDAGNELRIEKRDDGKWRFATLGGHRPHVPADSPLADIATRQAQAQGSEAAHAQAGEGSNG